MLSLKLWRTARLRRRVPGIALVHAEAEPFTYEPEQVVSDEWTKDETIARYIEEEEGQDEGPELVSFLRRAKNILSSQWRCQLSTVQAAGKSDPFHVSIVQYAYFRKPYVCLSNQDQLHKTNLMSNANVTLLAGHCDPPALAETIKLLGKVPPHVTVSGILAFAGESEVKMVKEGISMINAAAKEVVEIGGQALSPIFEQSKSLLNTQFESRMNLLSTDSNLSVYMLRPNSCQYVDLAGEKHEVDILQGNAPSYNAFAALFAGIIEGVNQNDSMRFALKAFCMVHRHVNVEEALLYSVDKKGFDVLAKVVRSSTSSSWKGFRFNFKRKVTDAIGLCRQLVAIEKECWEILSKSPALATLLSNAGKSSAVAASAPEASAEQGTEGETHQDPSDRKPKPEEEESETALLIDLL